LKERIDLIDLIGFFCLEKIFFQMPQIHHQKQQRAVIGILIKIPKSISIISKYLKCPTLRLNQGL
jgi:hypothetical protein